MAKYRKLSRTSSQRKALLRGQVTALLNNGTKNETTRPMERIPPKITKAVNIPTLSAVAKAGTPKNVPKNWQPLNKVPVQITA